MAIEGRPVSLLDPVGPLEGTVVKGHVEQDGLDRAFTYGTAAAANVVDFATAAQGTTADSAVQPIDLTTVAFTGAYSDLTGLPSLALVATSGSYPDLIDRPTLGTAAATAATDYATAAQGAKADTALQPAAIDLMVKSDTTQAGGGTAFDNTVGVTETEYNAIATKDPNTLYIRTGS